MGIVRSKIKGAKEIAQAPIDKNRAIVLGSGRLTAMSEDNTDGQSWRQGSQRDAADVGPGGSESDDHRGAVRAREEGGGVRAAGSLHPHLKRQACARFSGQH